MIQLNKNSMKPQKPTGQRKDPWPQGHATAQLPKHMGRTEDTIQKEMQKSQTWEKLKEISYCYSTDKMISCHIPVQTLRADVKIFKGGNIANFFCFDYYTKPVFFKYSKVSLNNGICQSSNVSVCTTLEFLFCRNWNYWCRNFQTSQ